jgi:hypothetical protein
MIRRAIFPRLAFPQSDCSRRNAHRFWRQSKVLVSKSVCEKCYYFANAFQENFAMLSTKSNEEAFHQLDVLDRLARLPDSTFLTTSEAAIFLRSSVSALETLRSKGVGPEYSQQGAKGVAGFNQKCLYEKADLLAWQRAGKVSSTVEAAVRKGQLFSTLFDLVQTEAFWVDALGRVIGMVEAAPVSVVVQRVGMFDIEWMPVIDAAARGWTSLAEHTALADRTTEILSAQSQRVAAGVERTDFSEEIRSPESGARSLGIDGGAVGNG